MLAYRVDQRPERYGGRRPKPFGQPKVTDTELKVLDFQHSEPFVLDEPIAPPTYGIDRINLLAYTLIATSVMTSGLVVLWFLLTQQG